LNAVQNHMRWRPAVAEMRACERPLSCPNCALGWKKAPYLASFHQGMAGIGYEFLRLAAPDSLPSLLLWE